MESTVPTTFKKSLSGFHKRGSGASVENVALAHIHQLLTSLQFPFNRVGLAVDFDYALLDFARHKIEARCHGRQGVKGEVILTLNGLFLYQKPGLFLDECIPHELAHVMNKLECIRGGAEPDQKHGDDFVRWFYKMSEVPVAKKNFDGDFDSRAITFMRGGICCRCRCPGELGFDVIPNTKLNVNKLGEKVFLCSRCEDAKEPVDHADVPERISREVDFAKLMTRANVEPSKQLFRMKGAE